MDLSSDVRSRIAQFLDAREGRTLRLLSSRTGIPHTTLWNISKGSVKPSFTHSLSLLTVITTTEDATSVLEHHFPDEAKKAARIYSLTRPSLGSDVYRDFLTGSLQNHIFSLASTRAGVTRERARELYGEAGVECLETLESHELVAASTDGRYRGTRKEFSNPNAADAIDSFRTRLLLTKKEHFGTHNALLGMLTESVTEEAQERIREILGTALRDVYGILSDPANSGPKTVFVGCVLNLLDETPVLAPFATEVTP
jgi:hypothetical protein